MSETMNLIKLHTCIICELDTNVKCTLSEWWMPSLLIDLIQCESFRYRGVEILFVVNVYFLCVNASKELMLEYSLWRGVIDIHQNTLISQVQRYDCFFFNDGCVICCSLMYGSKFTQYSWVFLTNMDITFIWFWFCSFVIVVADL